MKNCTSFINIQCYRIGYRKCLPIILSILFLVSGAMAQSSKTAYEKLSDTKKEEIQGMLKYYDKQIYFNENRGQWPSNVLYKADFHLGQALVTPDGMMVGTFDPVSAAAISAAGIQEEIDIQNGLRKHLPRSSPRGHGWLMKFLNSSPEMTIESKHKHADVFNYFMGNKSNANTNNYQEVWYNNVYNNVDVRYYPSEEGTLEYDIVCKPGFDKENIAIQMKGIDEVVINKNGHLVLKTSVGDVDFPAPVAYQLINGKQQSVEANYRVSDKNIVHFNLGKYNPALPLIIDPIALRWATWVSTNSTGDNHGHCIWVDQSDGAIYVVARVDGSTNRITVGALDTTAAGGIDMIVGKYLEPANVGGTGTRVWQTYIGGSGNDNPYAMEQGPDGNLYITGYTSSSDFPLTSNGSIFGGSYLDQSSQTTDNIFITKITKTGTSIKSAVVGGNGDDGSFDLRIAKTGEITVCGNTKSTNLATLYPGTGASNTNHSGIDALVFKINQDLSSIIWMKNNGGSKDDQPTILSQDPRDGSIYIGGYTASTNFPVMNARQSTQSNTNNTRSGFLTKLKSTGDTVWSSYFRSAPGKQTSILCMELDTLNNKIYFGGITEGLDTSNIHAGTYDNSYGGGSNDFFVSSI